MSAAGGVYLWHEQVEDSREAQALLASIGKLKVAQLESWREERQRDAQFFSHAAFVARDVQAFLADPEGPNAQAELTHWLTLLKAGDRYATVALLDTNLMVRLALPPSTPISRPMMRTFALAALENDGIFMSDLHVDPLTHRVDIDILFAVFPPEHTGGSAPKAPLAFVLLQLDPHHFMFPLVQSWPIPTRTGSIQLVRREGNDVVVLNDCACGTNSAMSLRLPLASFDRLPIAMAAQGAVGVVKGIELGNPVLASIHPVKDTRWILVAKLDQDEIFSSLRRYSFLMLGLTLLLAIAVGLAVMLARKRREAAKARRELAAEQQLRLQTEQNQARQREADERVRRSEARLRLISENMADVIWTLDVATMRFTYVSPSVFKLRGYTPDEVVKQSLAEVLTPESLHRVAEGLPALLERFAAGDATARTGIAELDQFHRDGSIVPTEVTTTLLPDATGRAVEILGVTRDISERKRADAERVLLEAQLRQAQKLEAIGTLAGGVAHEVNNPIQGIMSYAEIIAEDNPEGSQSNRFAREIVRETERVARIVRNLLHFARHENQDRGPASMRTILEQTLSLVRTLMRRDHITLEVDIAPLLPPVVCDTQQIQQVLMNLITNARDAILGAETPIPERSRLIRIAVGPCNYDAKLWVRTTVEDHGPGIPAGIRDRIFEPFFTTKPKDKGTGLGLSISYGILLEHDGRLSAESEPGKPTRFHIDLPAASLSDEGPASEGSPPAQPEA